MAPERIKRCLSTDKAQAEKFYSRLIIDQVSDIKTAVMNLENFVIESRDANSAIYVPQHIPIVCFQDTFSKLMSPGEAEGVSVYEGDRAPVTELGTNANPEAAKIAHSWARRWPYFLSHYNVILFFARHLNDKVDMSGGGGGSFGGGSIAGDAYNRTSRGGKAFNQNAALQMTLSRIKYLSAKIDGQDEKVGVQGQITVVKNSYGADGKKLQYVINTVPRTDTDTYQEPSMSFATSTCDWLFNHKLLPMTKKNNNCYTAKSLDLYDVPCDEFHRVFHSKPELIEQLGKQLGIYGYTNVVAEPATPAVAQEASASDAAGQETLSPESSASSTDTGDQVADAGGGVIRVKRKYTKRKK
jgi:hypothetical protein